MLQFRTWLFSTGMRISNFFKTTVFLSGLNLGRFWRYSLKPFLVTATGIIAAIGLILGIAVLLGSFYAALFWLAWNYAVVPIFGLKAITFFQAWALLVIVNILLSGVRYVVNKDSK